MKNKKWILLVTICITLLLTACGNSLKEKDIKEDVQTEVQNKIGETEEIDTITIKESQTNDDKTETIVQLQVDSNDGKIAYTRYYTATYYRNEDKEWVLNDVSNKDENIWEDRPIVGVDEEDIKNSLVGAIVSVDEGNWTIEKDEIKEIKIEKQETNLEKKKDKVTVNLTLNAEVETTTGSLEIKYSYVDGWQLDSMSEKTEFTAKMRSDKELKVTEQALLAVIMETETKFAKNTTYEQTLTIQESNVSDFEISKISTSEKGKYRVYDCKFILNKQYVSFAMSSIVTYCYDSENGWSVQNAKNEAQVEKVNLVGKWNGTYTFGSGGTVTLNITEMTEEGVITGTYSYRPTNVYKYDQPGSYRVSGKIDLTTLSMTLVAGDWVEKDSSATTGTKVDVRAVLHVEKMMLRGQGQDNYGFTAKQ